MRVHFPFALALALASAAPASAERVSYYHDVLPLFQAHCHGCHQPAKAKGDYVMTDFGRLVAGGDEGEAVVPGDAEASLLVELITADAEGHAEMPKKADPLPAEAVGLIGRWVAEGAVDDTPENARRHYDRDHPPVYTRPPVITALDYSPDGVWLAVSGFHEVLVHKADGSAPVARLVGLSERVESVAFSPDGKWLAVTGGLPARMGEVQVWDLEKMELHQSLPVTADTVFGASWSPDSRLLAFGCTDSAVRVLDVGSGTVEFYNAAHDDWALDTVFSVDGKRVASVGRDQTVKAYEVETQRFIDNITSITPGALKGGIHSIDRHPERDEVLVGGSDGVPQIFRLDRIAKRVIGDNSNLVRRLPPMRGRVFAVAFSPDGRRAVAGSSLDGDGQVHVYDTGYDPAVSDGLKRVFEKQPGQFSGEEREMVEAYQTQGVSLVASVDMPGSPVYALAVAPDGSAAAFGGEDGRVRIVGLRDGAPRGEFVPVKVAAHPPEELAGLEVAPPEIELDGRFAKLQAVVTAVLADGRRADVTRLADFEIGGVEVEVSPEGQLQGAGDGAGELVVRYAGQRVVVPVTVSGTGDDSPPDYLRDVNPVVTKLGCNAGTCHGSKDGANGFKLSLRGYDPVFDLRSFTDDHASRRINRASPDDSLMLLKATAAAPHEGGQLTRVGDDAYEIIRRWIAAGAEVDPEGMRPEAIEVQPVNPVVATPGDLQQMRVVARYPDGSQRDVTADAFIDSGNNEVAEVADGGLVTTLRRGEAPLLARYEGAYAATTVTVMGDRTGLVWEDPEVWGEIDRLVAAKWKRTLTVPSPLCSDTEFLRRVHLDLTGLPPSADEVRAFVADGRPTREKRDAVVDRLIGSENFIDHWTNKWADLLQVNRKFLGPEGATGLRGWIRDHVAANTPYDEFVRAVVTAAGSNRENPAASYFKILRSPEDTMENTTHLFLATRFNCNKCHDHPFERWTQDQYYEMAAFFAQVGLERDPESGDRNIGGTAVEGAKPLYEVVSDRGEGEVIHGRTGLAAEPAFPYEAEHDCGEGATRRERLAGWITSPDNRYFASSYVNRVWGYLLGTGIIEPIDDIRAGNPPSNPELLDHLTAEFVESGFDARALMAAVCKSRTYQLSVETNRWNEDDGINFSHAKPKRLPAEVLYDTIYASLGARTRFPGVPEGTRAAALPDVGVKLDDGFLGNLGRPPRESSCECERSNDLELGSVMALLSGPTVGDAVSDPKNALADLAGSDLPDSGVVDEVFVRLLGRPPAEAERGAALAAMGSLEGEHAELAEALSGYQAEVAPRESERREAYRRAIADAEAAVRAREEEIAPAEAEKDAAQDAEVTRLRAELAAYEEEAAPRVPAWAAAQLDGGARWQVLELADVAATNGSEPERLDDGSVFFSGPQGKGSYTFTAAVDSPVTGILIEALPDERLPQNGPGRAGSGNFVLTELVVHQITAGEGEGAEPGLVPVQLARAEADSSQGGYPVASAIDGNRDAEANNGWAIHPEVGRPRRALFELREPSGSTDGGPARLKFELAQNYADGQHNLGRFRVSATSTVAPLGLEFPEDVRGALAAAEGERTPEQQAALAGFYFSRDPAWQQRKAALDQAAAPRPVDPELKALRDTLAEKRQPFREDPKLVQLRDDVALSSKQLENHRLTALQDLAWALVNTPAFLFNH